MTRQFFVFGLAPLHCEYLNAVRGAEQFQWRKLFSDDEIVWFPDRPMNELLSTAEQTISRCNGNLAGIINHWDFPSSALHPFLCKQFGLRAATPEAVLKCEHKYWSRLEQKKALPEWIPEFCPIDPFAQNPVEQLTIDFPFWLKPVVSHSSQLGFRIENEHELLQALKIIRADVRRLGELLNTALARVQIPTEIGEVDGNWCIAEALLKGKQCGIEGTMVNGSYHVHGIVDTVKDSHNLSFTRYEYPSVWPEYAQQKICDAGETLLRQIGFDNSAFGIEFFWDEETDDFKVLEINTRISQSHSDQFIKVHGVSNHEAALDIPLNRHTDFSGMQGDFHCAAKFMLRRYEDTTVTRVPTRGEIKALEEQVPGCKISILVDEGSRLSDLASQDSYSFEVANICLGGQDQEEMLLRYRDVARALHFEFSDGQDFEPFQFESVRY
ncbi:acetyl-CoA carboxylase biotin carboxylase subunit [Microbulbifer aggregans]|uniref:Acetyl-CoA carboxylase biotin carboxylase subunit n=1 Tax=Microbulbifer aggregans TaxID=1769779 RepID=A0A1C9WA82_9GAMM|nr:hypothetical protein [Microbulbifer aggregans]AOS98074.1 acetyl-CoA carboxylase biotin carboxylase subunit [Microbulbifer aggregans]